MTIDIPHILVTALIILGVLWLVNHSMAFDSMTKRKRSLILFGVLFVILSILNTLWPYGATA